MLPILGWIVAGIVSYILLRVSFYFSDLALCLDFPGHTITVWTRFHTAVWMTGCILLSPVALMFGVVFSIGSYLMYRFEKAKKDVKNKKKSWFDKKSPF